MDRTQQVITALLQVARPEIRTEFREDSCIASTAVGIDVLTHFGVLSEPFPVRTSCFNGRFVARIEAGHPWPRGLEVHQWAEEDASYSVGIGFGTGQPGKWAGHLVIIAEKQYLIDLSIDQASRPLYNMSFEPLAVRVDEKFLSGSVPLVFKYEDGIIKIEPLPGNDGYLASPDWTFAGRRRKIIGNVVAKMEDILK